MPRLPTIVIILCVLMPGASAPLSADALKPAPLEAERPPAAPPGLQPIVVGTPETLPPGSPRPSPKASPARPPEPPPAAVVDASAHTVRFPVAMGRPQGLVERLVSCDLKHVGVSIFTTPCSARDLAKAFDRAGFPGGRPPAKVGEDRPRPPSGPEVEISLVVRAKDGRETRSAVSRYLSHEPRGEPLAEGCWVWVGPQVIRDGDAEILVPGLSGTLVTTDLEDSSAMAYRVAADEKAGVGGRAYYVSSAPMPPQDASLEIEVRLVPAAKPPASAE